MPRKKKNKSIVEYKLKNGLTRFKFQIRLNDGVTRRSGFITYEEAEAAYTNLRQEKLLQKNRRHINIPTFKELYIEWDKRYEPTVRSSTYVKTKWFFNTYILPYFSKYKMNKISTRMCQIAVDDWGSKIINYRMCINYANKIFNEALKYEYIYRNPMQFVDIPKKTEHTNEIEQNRNPKNFFEKEEMNKFLECAKEYNIKFYYYFEILAFTGGRPGEVLALKWEDINFNNATVHIHNTVANGKNNKRETHFTKTGDERFLVVDNSTLLKIKEWYKIQSDLENSDILSKDKLLFETYTHNIYKPNAPSIWMKTINERYGLRKVTPHGFRHTHATILYDENPEITLKDVQKRLGHASEKTTERTYTHDTERSDSKILDALNKFANNN